MSVKFICVVVGVICLFCAGLGVSGRVNFGWLGLAFLALAQFIL